MVFKDFYTGKDDEGRRLDKVLRIFIENQSLSSIYKFLRKGLIKVNDKKASPDYRIKPEDKISIAEFIFSQENSVETKENSTKSKLTLPPVVYENSHVIFFNKPANLTVHGENSLEEIFKDYYKSQNSAKKNLAFNPGPLHRIDRMTSGIVAFSQSIEGAHWFSDAIKNHWIQKKYIVILQGHLNKIQYWEDFIKAPDDNKKEFHKVEISSKQLNDEFKIAQSSVKPLAHGKFQNLPITVALIEIKTGRQHQIRSQSSFHGFPLFGDTAYGGTKNPETENFFLHAACLEIPDTNPIQLPSKIIAALPENFSQFITKSCDCDIKTFDI